MKCEDVWLRPTPERTPGSVSVARDNGRIRDAINDLKAFQKTHRLEGLSVRQMIEEGRRY